jgi:hypothetical protein
MSDNLRFLMVTVISAIAICIIVWLLVSAGNASGQRTLERQMDCVANGGSFLRIGERWNCLVVGQ